MFMCIFVSSPEPTYIIEECSESERGKEREREQQQERKREQWACMSRKRERERKVTGGSLQGEGVPRLKVTQLGVRVRKRGKVQLLLPVKVQFGASVIGHAEMGLTFPLSFFLSPCASLSLSLFSLAFSLSVCKGCGVGRIRQPPWGL